MRGIAALLLVLFAAVPAFAEVPALPTAMTSSVPLALIRDADAPSVPPAERRGVVIRTLLGLLALMALAYVAGHPRVQAFEDRAGISQVLTAGFAFVLLGVLARRVSVLSDPILHELTPMLRIGLGWIGFVVGFRFDARLFTGLPSQTTRIVSLVTAIPFGCVLVASGGLLWLFSAARATGELAPTFFRDALLLGTAGAVTATSTRLLPDKSSAEIIARIVRLQELAGILGLVAVAAYFRPSGAELSWQLPGTAWLFLTVGLGVTVAGVIYAILQQTHEGAEFVVLTLGSISFVSGIAGVLFLSPVAVAFIAGLFLVNFPGTYKKRLGATLERLERPIYLLSLVVVGALWHIGDWRGWVLMPVFMGARLAGKWLGTTLALRGANGGLGRAERGALAFAPMGPLAIAIVVNAQLLYASSEISLLVSAVIGGAMLTEVAIQVVGRGRPTLVTAERGAPSLAPLPDLSRPPAPPEPTRSFPPDGEHTAPPSLPPETPPSAPPSSPEAGPTPPPAVEDPS